MKKICFLFFITCSAYTGFGQIQLDAQEADALQKTGKQWIKRVMEGDKFDPSLPLTLSFSKSPGLVSAQNWSGDTLYYVWVNFSVSGTDTSILEMRITMQHKVQNQRMSATVQNDQLRFVVSDRINGLLRARHLPHVQALDEFREMVLAVEKKVFIF